VQAVDLNRGAIEVSVIGFGAPPGGFDRATLLAIARAQADKVADAGPAGAATDDVSYAIGRLVGTGVVFVGVVVVAFVVIRKLTKKSDPVPVYSGGYAQTWAQPASTSYAPEPLSAPAYTPPPVPTMATAAPMPGAETPAAEPSPFAPPVATATQSANVIQAQSHTCGSCGHDFGVKDMCANCETPRTRCAVCGVKIWAGAMTCSEHSGMVR
jgi:hypothetical protein